MDKIQPFLVAVGASGAEGLQDIRDVLAALPQGLNAVVLVVLHRQSDGVTYLGEILQASSTMPVEIASDGMTARSGICYIGTPDGILTAATDNRLILLDGSNNRLRNRTIDRLFESVAQQAKDRAIGVVLSGALADGSRGLAAIHAAGGLTIVLDPKGKTRGMQQNAIDYDGPITRISGSNELCKYIAKTCGYEAAKGSRS